MDCDVVVVGAGLAGLECARTLGELGVDVTVVEAAEAVGGRVRSETIDGFTVDRGFQLLNPAYPMVRRRIDLTALDLQSFEAGVAVRRESGLAVVADPRRSPRRIAQTLRSGYLRPRELAALARWAAPALRSGKRLLASEDSTLTQSLAEAHVRGRLRREVLEPFLAGVLADDTGQTSATFVRLLVRMFLLGTPAVPAAGMGALPRQIADDVRGHVALGTPVRGISRSGNSWRVVSDADSWTARCVVVATDPRSAEHLAGTPSPTMKGLVTFWYATPTAPTSAGLLVVDGRRRPAGPVTTRTAGPVINAAVMPAAYAPPGRHLVEVTCLLAGEVDEAEARRQAGEMVGAGTGGWQEITRHEIPDALPSQPAPQVTRTPVALGDGLFVCGDHRDTASIQGALVSGHRTARAVAAALRG